MTHLHNALRLVAESEGYKECRFVPGRGLCGLSRRLYTVGLFHGLNFNPLYDPYAGRYCYPTYAAASAALASWDGKTDPPDEDWIKHKGRSEYSNPKNQNNDSSYVS